jgi:hypothetical protein
MSFGVMARRSHGYESRVSDTGIEVINSGDARPGGMKSSLPRVRHGIRVLIEHPSTIDTEIVDLVDVLMIVNALEIPAFHARSNDLGYRRQRST